MTRARLRGIAKYIVLGCLAQVLLDLVLVTPWRVLSFFGGLILLRTIWGLWREAPYRNSMVALLSANLIVFVLVYIILRPFVVQLLSVSGEAMVPTLRPGDRILVNKFIYRLNWPRRGDVIVFVAPPWALQPNEGPKDYVSRLIGLPGDKILVRRQQGVFVNGTLVRDAPGVPLPENDWPNWSLPGQQSNAAISYEVPPGCCFVMGENRDRSNDSRVWVDRRTSRHRPELPYNRVLGKVFLVFWPPSRLHLMRDTPQAYVPGPPLTSAALHGTGG